MTRFLFPALLLLAACAPAPQSQAAGLLPVATWIDRNATQGVIGLQIAALQATSDANSLAATSQAESAAAATQAASFAATQAAEGRTATAGLWTATADADRSTATQQAQGTATALFAPFAVSTLDALSRKARVEENRTTWRVKVEPVRQSLPIAAAIVALSCVALIVRVVTTAALMAIREHYAPPYYEPDPPALPTSTERPQLTLYTGERGAVSGMTRSPLPCTVEEMNLIAFWVVQRGDTSLAVNKWEERGLSGRIDEVREWFVERHFADLSDDNRVTVNEQGIEFLEAWRGSHERMTERVLGMEAR